jgi:hypothetical protein
MNVDSPSIVSNVDYDCHCIRRGIYSGSFFGFYPTSNFVVARVSLNST